MRAVTCRRQNFALHCSHSERSHSWPRLFLNNLLYGLRHIELYCIYIHTHTHIFFLYYIFHLKVSTRCVKYGSFKLQIVFSSIIILSSTRGYRCTRSNLDIKGKFQYISTVTLFRQWLASESWKLIQYSKNLDWDLNSFSRPPGNWTITVAEEPHVFPTEARDAATIFSILDTFFKTLMLINRVDSQ